MRLEFKQQLKLTQQLVMTPQLQQAIKLLQLSRMELVDLVREEMLENPVLEDGVETEAETAKEEPKTPEPAVKEVEGNDKAVNEIDWEAYLDSYATSPSLPSMKQSNDDLPSLEATLAGRGSLSDHLMWQLSLIDVTIEERRIGEEIIGNLDPDGYLREASCAEIAETLKLDRENGEASVEGMLGKLQKFDPIGVAARDLSECLLVQAKHLEIDDDILVSMITVHMGNLERRNYQAIAKDLKQPLEEIYEAAKAIQALDPRPGRQYQDEEIRYITPDVYIYRIGEEFFVVPNDDGLPKLRISSFYKNALAKKETGAREYVQNKLRSAQWLIRSIHQRQRTILKVTESIVKFQREFFEKGIGHLRPMILRDVAEDIGMHESTISRVTTNKYVSTPQGIYELKFFFNSGINRTSGEDIASQSVKSKIKGLIGEENPKKPLSDQALTKALKEQGIEIARRTVAKYREQLGILSSSKRKRVF